MESIKKLNNNALLYYYNQAIRNSHYNPSDTNYNDSGFTESELEDEVLLRMNWESYKQEDEDE